MALTRYRKKHAARIYLKVALAVSEEVKKIFYQELKNSGREGKFNIRTEKLPWERSRSQSGQGWKAMT
jgi:hypothetical protein